MIMTNSALPRLKRLFKRSTRRDATYGKAKPKRAAGSSVAAASLGNLLDSPAAPPPLLRSLAIIGWPRHAFQYISESIVPPLPCFPSASYRRTCERRLPRQATRELLGGESCARGSLCGDSLREKMEEGWVGQGSASVVALMGFPLSGAACAAVCKYMLSETACIWFFVFASSPYATQLSLHATYYSILLHSTSANPLSRSQEHYTQYEGFHSSRHRWRRPRLRSVYHPSACRSNPNMRCTSSFLPKQMSAHQTTCEHSLIKVS